ncbi:arylamine N-acetyltransferase [Bacillus sp. Marseille-P3800]|uniref:arylamine N-acetyltransferase n=1 Tax=Bacillus sp. Marseille-P3800 TaxID=2014782 RepID=UPI000C089170|nr:arylamine N-acetyltransferase [Bacillus sp. Marseille-P3800]
MLKTRIVDRYVNAIQVSRQEPTLVFLKEICRNHLQTFPFENLSKLITNKNITVPTLGDVEAFLDQYEQYGAGGTCYMQNSILLNILTSLSFNCRLIQLGGVHMAIIVNMDEQIYYVDCGAAAPFFKPILLEKQDTQSEPFGSDMITFTYKGDSEFEYQRYLEEKKSGESWLFNLNHSFTLKDFDVLYRDSFKSDATFMKLFRCQLYQLNQCRSVSIVNNTFTIRYMSGEKVTKKLKSIEELETCLHDEFHLTSLPVKDSVRFLKENGIALF